MRFKTLCALAAAGLMAGMAACSAGEDDTGGTFNSTDATGTNVTTGNAAGGSSGTMNGAGGTQAVSIGTGSGGEEICESTDIAAVPKTLNIFTILDRSGSMGQTWFDAVDALTLFFQDPANMGINAAMNFFPVDGVGDQCNPGLHNPPQVALTAIPANAMTLINAMTSENANGGNTPTYPAIEGTVSHAVAYNQSNPTEVTIVVFISDGSPNGCNTNSSAIAALAAAGFNSGSPGVRTYALALPGIPSNGLNALDEIAAAGGTMQAIDISNNISLFKQKMDEIRNSALGCEYNIPIDPNNPNAFDPSKANVKFDPGGGGMATDYVNVPDAASCGNTLGWYYDDNNNPTQILLCPAACSMVEQAAMIPNSLASVLVAFGCPIIQQ